MCTDELSLLKSASTRCAEIEVPIEFPVCLEVRITKQLSSKSGKQHITCGYTPYSHREKRTVVFLFFLLA